ncbi:MAG: GNAT family N-acetyltransferase [Rhodobacteraceae bacterium]|nr:GNAT family N-acetyltransferase [Paracoccaceae bacterium]
MSRSGNQNPRQSDWHVRTYRADDAAACAEVFRHAVLQGAAAHYDQKQRDAWAAGPDADSLHRRLAAQLALVSVDTAGQVNGFFSLTDGGLVDFAFVMPDLRGTGLADHLLERLTEAARARGLTRMTTEASLVARSFFARNGWSEERRQTVTKGDVQLDNFVMSLDLGIAESAA